jgi:hypothetical protein
MTSETITGLILTIVLLLYLISQIVMTTIKKTSPSIIQLILIVIGVLFALLLTYRGKELDVNNLASTLLTIGLVTITAVYAGSTEKMAKATKEQAEATKIQAEASVKMAKEMENQRYDAVRPIIDIYMEGEPIRRIGEQLSSESDLIASGLSCRLKNVGFGPAIDFYSFIFNPQNNEHYKKDFGTLVMNESTPMIVFALQRDESGLAIVAHYKDVFGRSFQSKRHLLGNENDWRLGTLNVSLV